MSIERKKKVCVVVSAPMTVTVFLRDQLRALSERYELWVVANALDDTFLKELGIRAHFYRVAIERKIVPFADFLAFCALWKLFVKEGFDLVHSVTPKAGLLAMGAAFFARVPVRVHIFTGQVWANKRGFGRNFLRWMDQRIAGFATRVLVDSKSQRAFLIRNGVVTEKDSQVLGAGSISGVDAQRFSPNEMVRSRVRTELGIGKDDFVFLYVGRLNRDKGIPELLEAFDLVCQKVANAWLLVVGPDEEGMEEVIVSKAASARVLRVGYTKTPEDFMRAGDVFVLPSHREGFGSTVIEAAAVGMPAIATRIYGLTDAVVDGETGCLIEVKDVEALRSALERFANQREMTAKMGEQAHARALAEFAMAKVTEHTLAFYREVLS